MKTQYVLQFVGSDEKGLIVCDLLANDRPIAIRRPYLEIYEQVHKIILAGDTYQEHTADRALPVQTYAAFMAAYAEYHSWDLPA